MAKILKLNNDADYYYERGIDKCDASDFIEAIDNFYLALHREGENIWIYSEIAGSYLELGLVDQALRMYYRIIALEKKADIGYLGVMQCLIRQNLVPQALYYLSMGVKTGALSSDLELSEDFFEEDESRVRLKLAGKADADMVKFARKLMISGDTEYARQMLESIPTTSNQYIAARGLMALIALGENRPDRALELTEDALKADDTDIAALTTRIVAYHLMGENALEEEVTAYLDSLILTDRTEIHKAAVCMQQVQNNRMAIKYLTMLLEFQPYERDTLLLLSIAHSNCREHRKARQYMLILRKLYRDDMTVCHYARLFNKDYMRQLELSVDLPDSVKRMKLNYLKRRIRDSKDSISLELQTDERYYETVQWLFQSDEHALMGKMGALLAAEMSWQGFVRDLLIEPKLHHRVKKECLLSLIRNAKEKRFTLLVSDVLQFYNPRLPKCTENPQLIDAYWQMYTTLAFIDSDFDKRLNAAFRGLCRAVKAADLTRFELNADVLAAVMANTFVVHKIFESTTDCCEIFGCEETEVQTYMRVLKLSAKPKGEE